jgi:hypothetical protein
MMTMGDDLSTDGSPNIRVGDEDGVLLPGTGQGGSYYPAQGAYGKPDARWQTGVRLDVGGEHEGASEVDSTGSRGDYPDTWRSWGARHGHGSRHSHGPDSPFKDPEERIREAREKMRALLKKTFRFYGEKVSHTPCCCVIFWSIIAGVITFIGAVVFPPVIETDFDSFLVTDVESSIRLSAFDAAMDARDALSRRLSSDDVDVTVTTTYTTKVLLLIYEVQGDIQGGAFDDEILQHILDFEASLRAMPAWTDLCGRVQESKREFCDPGISAARYFLPTFKLKSDADVIPEALVFDGNGFDMLPPQTALLAIQSHGLTDLVLPQDGLTWESAAGASPKVIRSAFRFSIPCGTGSSEDLAKCADGFNAWREFFTDHLHPFLSEPYVVKNTRAGDGEDEYYEPFKVWYFGSDVDDFEVIQAIVGDFWYAFGSMLAVHLYVLVHTRSFLLALTGPLISVAAVPLTYALCAIIFGHTQVSFASFLALFLVVGFGADVAFVYTDFWDQSLKKDDLVSDTERVLWTYAIAAKASLATTATTALSFLANLASAIRALRQFALFMGLCVMVTWMLISLVYLPLCVFDERVCSRYRLCHRRRISFFSPWVRHLRRWRYLYIVIALACSAAGAGIAAGRFTLVSSVSLFPEDHNQNRGKKVSERFESPWDILYEMGAPPVSEESVCVDDSGTPSGCLMEWCEAQEREDPLSCSAFERLGHTCSASSERISATIRIVGKDSVTATEAGNALLRLAEDEFGAGFQPSFAHIRWDNPSPPEQLLNEWESGAMELHSQQETTEASLLRGTGAYCDWDVVAYCGGALECSDHRFRLVNPSIQITSSSRRVSDGLGVVPTNIPKSRWAKVRAVFGLWTPSEIDIFSTRDPASDWRFLMDVPGSTFVMDDPWTQRNLNQFCAGITTKLRVVDYWCWMEDFQGYTKKRYGSFPVRSSDFASVALEFTKSSYSSLTGTDYIWMINDEIRAMYFSFAVDVDYMETDFDMILDLKMHWDEYIEDWNSTAKPVARNAFHVSKLWVAAESSRILVSGTVMTVGILLILAFGGMLAFTWSIVLSLYVVMATVCVMCCLTFLIIVVLDWSVGLIEVVAIIYFVGYAVTYSLHVAHKYASNSYIQAEPDDEAFARQLATDQESDRPKIRYLRTVYSLKAIGGAALGSAITTSGAAFFLTFCTLTIFTKLGGMCLAVSVLSAIMAIGPLPAVLLSFGPIGPGACSCAQPEPYYSGQRLAATPERIGTRE